MTASQVAGGFLTGEAEGNLDLQQLAERGGAEGFFDEREEVLDARGRAGARGALEFAAERVEALGVAKRQRAVGGVVGHAAIPAAVGDMIPWDSGFATTGEH
jgi:hypothetical protein